MNKILEIEQNAIHAIEDTKQTQILKQIESDFLGKNGKLVLLMKELSTLPPSQRPLFGKSLNETKQRLEKAFKEKYQILKLTEQALLFESEKMMLRSLVNNPT